MKGAIRKIRYNKKIQRIIVPMLMFIPDRLYLYICSRVMFNKRINLNNPITLTDKLQWIKLHDRREILTTLSDKILAKEYVRQKFSEKILVPETLLILDSLDDIDIESLPNKFVIKTNGGSGDITVVTDKNSLDLKTTSNKYKKHLKRNAYYFFREWGYKNIKRKIFIEEFLGEGEAPPDYKFFVINNKVEIVMIIQSRYKKYQRIYLDKNLKPINTDFIKKKSMILKLDDFFIPKNIHEMMSLAEEMSFGFDFVRVDYYSIENKIYFGEFTFYPFGGIINQNPMTEIDWDRVLGDKLHLDSNKYKNK